MHSYSYPRPALTADIITLRFNRNALEILLIERDRDPFAGCYALPGGFIDEGESPPQAAKRELLEETSVTASVLHEVGTFGMPSRDPRGWVVSVAFLAFVPASTEPRAGDDARQARWFPLDQLPELAFDHTLIIERGQEALQRLTQTHTAPLTLIPSPFRHRHARYLYSQIWGESIPPRQLKAWLRRVEALKRVRPAQYIPTSTLKKPWDR
jgi:8-oxo-dGTP diphosphatase